MATTDTQQGTECADCGSITEDVVEHHVDYNEDTTVPVCRACHQTIHADTDHPLYPVGEPDLTSMRLSECMADELYDRKSRGESYEDVIWRLIEQAEAGDGSKE